MGHILGQFLSSSGPFFDQLIADLEKSTRHQSFDVDLVGELMTQVNGQLRQLGLIPGDILADEIRQALIAQYQQNQHEVAYQVFGESSDPKVRQHKLEIKLRESLIGYLSSYTYISLKYNYIMPSFQTKHEGMSGGLHTITIGFSGGARGVKRAY